ncbi:MAG TPA: hypothetical protein LFW20_03340 [Rickettsia endosymbiont of Omalisus fontisbellaquei]|jgi:hypothetical protein|nr:hypothetical protein [Rickettsia endosymbiont of Omalisus fontisbellaquei]
MSKNENITDKTSIPIPRLKSFDPTITRNNIISKQLFTSTSSDIQEELELSGNDKRPNSSCCEIL